MLDTHASKAETARAALAKALLDLSGRGSSGDGTEDCARSIIENEEGFRATARCFRAELRRRDLLLTMVSVLRL